MFWRDIGWKDDDEAVDARDGFCNMTDMITVDRRLLREVGGDQVGAREPQICHRSDRRYEVRWAVRLRRSPGMERRGTQGARGTICT